MSSESSETTPEDEYEVEAIRRRRVFKNRIQYLIKWKGWPEEANTWEDEENLSGCKDLLASFLENELKKEKRKEKNTLKILKVVGTADVNGKLIVKLLLSDNTIGNMIHSKAIREIPDLYFDYLEKNSVFRFEK